MEVYLKNPGCCHESHSTTLILGEGNFSFAREFAAATLFSSEETTTTSDFKVYATSFDSRETVHRNKFAEENVAALFQMKHVEVMHGIDATDLTAAFYEGKIFSRIIFNFPHVGGKSNIRKCRQLLKDFFESASAHVCDEGCVLVALCQGQGGTPVDVDRGGYGNTWQVASQAECSGFYLKDIERFDFCKLKKYKQAGYRGEIGNGFLTKGGFVHVFTKGKIFPVPCHQDLCHVNEPDDDNRDEIFKTYVKRYSSKISSSPTTENVFSKLQKLLRTLIQCKAPATELVSSSSQFESLPPNFIVYEGELYASRLVDSFPQLATGADTSAGGYEFRVNVLDMASLINPVSHCLTKNIVHVYRGDSSLDVVDQTDVIRHVFANFSYETVECGCDGPLMFNSQCACVVGPNPICTQYKINISNNNVDNGNDNAIVNIEPVPAFIENLPDTFWAGYPPECVISNHDGTKNDDNDEKLTETKIVYRNVSCNDYSLTLTAREELFFDRVPNLKKEASSACVVAVSKTRVIVNGLCVLTILRRHSDCSERGEVMLVFHMDQILVACYNVRDVRMLYTEDDTFHRQLARELENDINRSAISFIERHRRHYTKTIPYPLCHRHDLCFWLDDDIATKKKHSEGDLLSAVRWVCSDVIHTMRLIKVLRHEETNSVSYCYRMIYGRLDGPLDHVTCVRVQNELRLYLLRLGYALR